MYEIYTKQQGTCGDWYWLHVDTIFSARSPSNAVEIVEGSGRVLDGQRIQILQRRPEGSSEKNVIREYEFRAPAPKVTAHRV